MSQNQNTAPNQTQTAPVLLLSIGGQGNVVKIPINKLKSNKNDNAKRENSSPQKS